jgi:Fe-S-cluster formation regulator IscX/YfhJ
MDFKITTHTFSDDRNHSSRKVLAITKGKRLFAFYPDVDPTRSEALALQSRLVLSIPLDPNAEWKR